jgi:predicted phage terminase large subunit-like protein
MAAFLDAWLELTPDQRVAKWAKLPESKRAVVRVEAERIQRRLLYPYPSALGQVIEPETFIRTPMIELLDEKMLGVAEAVKVMQRRQKRRRELVRTGVDDKVAIEQAAMEIPSAGITRLIISAPPQEGKSWEITRFGVEWLLVYYPWLKVAIVSYDMPTAGKFSYDIREDITRLNGAEGTIDLGLRLAHDQRAINRWTLQSRGGVFSVGITGGITSRHIDAMVIDDAVKDIRAAESILQAQQAAGWWQTSGRTRLSPWAPVIVVMTAWDENDLRGQLIAKSKAAREAGLESFDDWIVLNIPAQADYDPEKGESDPLGREIGEYLQSARGRTIADWETTKYEATSRHWNAMYQGNPTPSLGNILKRQWWKRYDEALWTQTLDGQFILPKGYTVTQSWDLKFGMMSGGPTSDFVVGQVWAKRGADSFLLYEVHARLSFAETIEAIRRVSWLFPQATRKFVEDKANGPAVISSLKHEITGIIPSKPKASKTARAEAASPFIEAGNFYIPTQRLATIHPALVFDAEGFIDEHTAFPFGAHDDQVDGTTQYVKEMYIDRGSVRVHSPVGRTPTATPTGPEKSFMAQRVAANKRAS